MTENVIRKFQIQKRREFTNFVFCLLSGCNLHKNDSLQSLQSTHQSKDIIIKFGEKGSDFAKRNPELVKVEKQPAGLSFYSTIWTTKNYGNIILDNGNNSLRISNVLTLLCSEDTENIEASNSFQNIDIGARISNDESITHDKARVSFYEILHNAKSLGWRPILYESDPRIFGKERFNYAMHRDSTIGLDGEYIPTLDEWMRIEDMTEWRMYANGIFMSLIFQRDQNRMDLKESDAYIITFNFKTALEQFKGISGPDKRGDWKNNLHEALKKSAQHRARIESELKMQGFHIDESYENPAPPV